MKIVIYVDYSNDLFNKDFALSNALLDKGHQVFLVTSYEQLSQYINNGMDNLIRGYSAHSIEISAEYIDAFNYILDEVVGLF